jgi:hypothetical protein
MVYNTQQYGQNPNYQQPNYPQQPNQYNPQYGSPRPMGPPIGQLFSQSTLAKIGLVITILAIVGLIISFAAPWGYTDDKSFKDDYFGHDFENSDDQKMFGSEDYGGYFYGTPGMADIGLVFLMILGIISIIWGVIGASMQAKYAWFSLVGLIIAAMAVIPSLWVMIAGMRSVGFNIYNALNETKDSYLFPAGYIMLIFGLIFFVLVLKMLKDQNLSLGFSGGSGSGFPQMYFFKGGDKK